jgi:2-phosphosulfolactate phosphatase
LHITVQKLPANIVAPGETAAVVIDVLRATSAMATAIQNGADRIIACLEIEEARRTAFDLDVSRLLCGERHCEPIEGFDLGNSPIEYSSNVVARRTIVMTTTNGTRALIAAKNAKSIYAGAFVNLSAVAEKLRGERLVTLVCAGTDAVVTEEDVLFAGALIASLTYNESEITLDATALESLKDWQMFLDEGVPLSDRLAQSRGGRNLISAGYIADVEYCAQVDAVTAVPTAIHRDPMTLQ